MGTKPYDTEDPLARISSNIDKSPGLGPNGECHEWTAGTEKSGYGATWLHGKKIGSHRAIYALTHRVKLGRFDFICHTCDNPKCCNPAHLFLGKPKDNTADMDGKGRRNSGNAAKTHCKQGHEYSTENTYINATSGERICRTCQTAYMKFYPRKDYPKKPTVLKGRATRENGRNAQANKTHCNNGHEFTPENTYPNSATGHRQCKACRTASNNAQSAIRSEKRAAARASLTV